MASVLLRLKYGGRPDLGPALGELLAERCLELASGEHIDVVVPVPVPYARLIERGYNQAALIAAPVSKRLGAKFAPMALRRSGRSARQAKLGRQQRLRNLDGAFHVRRPKQVTGKHILLVDDVTTTGATLQVCSQLLLDAGAATVRTAVVAVTELSGAREVNR